MEAIMTRLTKFGLGLAIAGGIANSALYNVDAGCRGVIFDRLSGVKQTVSNEGTHFLIPFIQKPIIFDCKAQPRNIPVITGSKDLQNVHITLRILFRPKPSVLPNIFTTIGEDYDERILPSITNEVLKAVVLVHLGEYQKALAETLTFTTLYTDRSVTQQNRNFKSGTVGTFAARFDASELITQREVVSRQVSEDLAERADSFGLILDDVSLTHLTFGREFTTAVEQKQVAQQEAERARFIVEKAEQQKIASVTTAEGDAKAAEMIAKSVASAGESLIELRRLEAAEEIAGLMSKSRNVAYLPNSQNVLLSLNPNQ